MLVYHLHEFDVFIIWQAFANRGQTRSTRAPRVSLSSPSLPETALTSPAEAVRTPHPPSRALCHAHCARAHRQGHDPLRGYAPGRQGFRLEQGSVRHRPSCACSIVSDLSPSPPCSGAPFETEIGVGKVIKGWDEGMFCSFQSILP